MAVKGEVSTKQSIGRPLKFSDPEEFKATVERYFEQCNTLRDLPTITELAVYLKTDRKTLYNYRSKDDFFPTIKDAMAKCEAALEKRALLGGLNATMAIFSLKNNYGWVDKQEVDNTHKVVTPIMTLEEHDAVSGDDSDQED